MLQSSKVSFLLLFCLLALSTLALGNNKKDKTYKCDLRDRPNRDDCYKKPNRNSCAYYKKDCPLGLCGQPAYNGCDACSDPKVLYYTIGDCKEAEMVQSCYEGICNDRKGKDKFDFYEPVCGLKGKNGRTLTKTFDNVCDLCEKSSFNYFQQGVCKLDREYCDNDKKKSHSRPPPGPGEKDEYDPVCAHFTTDDLGSVFATASNSYEACKDKAVEFWTEGACGESRSEQTYCLPNNRPETCTLEYNPVCGFYKDKNGNLAHKVSGNPCSACAEEGILYHIPGPCVFECNLDPNIIFDCAGVLEPVCGTYIVKGKEYQVSLRNSCIGCYYSGKRILTYVDGLCPGDQGIRCENDAGAFIEGFLDPVCGYTRERCRRDSCRETYPEAILACSNPDTIWYSIGACRGDEGVSCDDYRTRPEDAYPLYQNVCGYTREDCNSSSCRRTYTDHYAACARRSVEFFTKGPC